MNKPILSRREALARTGLLAGAAALGEKLALTKTLASPAAQPAERPFIFCLNTATIRGQKLGIVKEIEVAAKAGYDAIEPWVEPIQAYVKDGGAAEELT